VFRPTSRSMLLNKDDTLGVLCGDGRVVSAGGRIVASTRENDPCIYVLDR
jgi:hypothetical protein